SLRPASHPSHSRSTTRWPGSSASKPERAVITNMTADLDHEVLRQRPARRRGAGAGDGMRLEVG
ncbi:hypothetical protein ACRAWF_13580, partial [Streptomyces sp. L7]